MRYIYSPVTCVSRWMWRSFRQLTFPDGFLPRKERKERGVTWAEVRTVIRFIPLKHVRKTLKNSEMQCSEEGTSHLSHVTNLLSEKTKRKRWVIIYWLSIYYVLFFFFPDLRNRGMWHVITVTFSVLTKVTRKAPLCRPKVDKKRRAQIFPLALTCFNPPLGGVKILYQLCSAVRKYRVAAIAFKSPGEESGILSLMTLSNWWNSQMNLSFIGG